jgi:hypothetical protein
MSAGENVVSRFFYFLSGLLQIQLLNYGAALNRHSPFGFHA